MQKVEAGQRCAHYRQFLWREISKSSNVRGDKQSSKRLARLRSWLGPGSTSAGGREKGRQWQHLHVTSRWRQRQPQMLQGLPARSTHRNWCLCGAAAKDEGRASKDEATIRGWSWPEIGGGWFASASFGFQNLSLLDKTFCVFTIRAANTLANYPRSRAQLEGMMSSEPQERRRSSAWECGLWSNLIKTPSPQINPALFMPPPLKQCDGSRCLNLYFFVG